ncbi:MAG: V-type ATP synthase subunit D [Methanobacteriota archaeon]
MPKRTLTQVRPTRIELLKLRRRVMIAEKGSDLLEEKLDALILEHSRIEQEIEKISPLIQDQEKQASSALLIAGMISGWRSLEEIAAGISRVPDLIITPEQVMGVKVVDIAFTEEMIRGTRGYSLVGNSAQVDVAAMGYERLLHHLVHFATLEGKADRISMEILSTRRRVNALKYLIIPDLEKTRRYIEIRLEEREREDLFRRKRTKQLITRKEQTGL